MRWHGRGHVEGCALQRGDLPCPATVLVCDDDATIRELLELNLRLDGYEVLTAHDGHDALDKAMALGPSLLLLEARLPGISGYTVCARLRALPAGVTVPVTMLTADTLVSARALARAAGADDVIVKPFDSAVLLDKVRVLLGRRG
jgi:DNA-binding response OmpR family regulator